MTPAALRKLGALMAARKARDLARLERLVAEDRALAAELAALASAGAADVASGEALPPDRQAVRLAWIDQRTAMLARRRGILAAEIAGARAAAIQSLGRERALDRLAEIAGRAEATRHAAREEREAPPADGACGVA
ncbi:MAG TPA: hypothetical protein VM422_05500 [Amaricoccus sp.]|nr:hypothetical protein [Amaricoccus sp.]